MLSERNIKLATLIETAKAVEASAIQIIEKLSGFGFGVPWLLDEVIKTGPIGVVAVRLVSHLNGDIQPAL